jgi:hypothetical protein
VKFSRAPGGRYAKAVNAAAEKAAREIVRDAIRKHEGVISLMAEWLEIRVPNLYKLVDELGLGPEIDAARRRSPTDGQRGRPPIPRAETASAKRARA